ncbi:hypothetical protein [Candidatus Palauibacter sp.]|uniref:hypothetical protein n=1 Tax=Candidatus Palauibacter sp. TaxID=3101350 RepID=UPI003B02B30E
MRATKSGPIPSELGRLAHLSTLSLTGNDLSGPIPSELGNLAELWSLWLSENELTGPIPPELGNLGLARPGETNFRTDPLGVGHPRVLGRESAGTRNLARLGRCPGQSWPH